SNSLDGYNFSIEMETGTGKTYVYLRSIYELNKTYGFKKFVIVVPSIAIKEGVLKNLEITHSHLQELYNKPPVTFKVYDTKNISYLRTFASSNDIQVLVINIDSFAKDENIINNPNDKLSGMKPIEFIKAVKPIAIIDEPQNMETEKRKKAITNLNPLCTLRYSATHTNKYNLIYSLNPIQAYDLGLVKQIEVDSIFTQNSFNDAYIRLDKLAYQGKTKLVAKLEIDINNKDSVTRKVINTKCGDDLYELSNKRKAYKDGFIINGMDVTGQYIEFSNGQMLEVGQIQGNLNDELLKYQIEKTIEEHFSKEKHYKNKGIKVLSLFFIDRVANYRSYLDTKEGAGKFALWFEELYNKISSKSVYKDVIPYKATEVHNGYFSKEKGKLKDSSGVSKADDDTYHLIMKDKEKLLDINNPLRFIFSHSALREGWDNPNVFQICTLNETKSNLKKRQEIGRGLRLSVNQQGERIFDKNINKLTVIANESYDSFAKELQKEIETDCGVQFSGRIKNKKERVRVNAKKNLVLDETFLELWNKIKYKTIYKVNYDTEELIKDCAKQVKQMPVVDKPKLVSIKNLVKMNDNGLSNIETGTKSSISDVVYNQLPDILDYIQSKTELTRSTIKSILVDSGRLSDIFNNPQLFLDLTVKEIKKVLNNLIIDGIKYQKIAGSEYEMRRFETEEIESYIENLYIVTKQEKTVYDHIIYDSEIEKQFAKDCETNENIDFYIKLPQWFKIKTPIGNYNPDWALILKNDQRLYFVAETKGKRDAEELRLEENLKIKCGTKHFEVFDDVEYKVATKLSDLIL
ncbi:DEAD/DEAH box helicase family protein, partial [Candidatus Margulisiibacteriota bacterium]